MRLNSLRGRTTILALVGMAVLASGRATAGTSRLIISGTPPSTVAPGQLYTFTPTASSGSGRHLRFRISNPPAWTTFSARRGTLSGTPTTSNVGVYPNIIISVSDGISTASLAPFSITVAAPGATSAPTPAPNTAPTISGTPATSVTVGQAYTFQPTAADANGDLLSFSVASKPAWASFSIATGQLYGTPSATDAGTYSNIVISVSDGQASTALPAFSITVNPLVVTGSAMLSWTPPAQNTDGSTLTDLAGYRIAYGTSADALTQAVQIPTAGVSSYTIDNLAQGTWYFALKSYNSAGTESALTSTVSKTIQ